jgi:hypothetical protein
MHVLVSRDDAELVRVSSWSVPTGGSVARTFFRARPTSGMNWADLFERAEEYETGVETIRERLTARRGRAGDLSPDAGDAGRDPDDASREADDA